MKIAIVNDIHVGKPLKHDGRTRASSHLVEDMLPNFLEDIVIRHSPDLLINLGDLIRSDEREIDERSYRRSISIFQRLKLPIIHLLGNHELKRMTLGDIENVWNDCGWNQKSYGFKNVGDFTVIWLGLELDAENQQIRSLPWDQLKWLKDHLESNHRPTIIFTHCAIDDHDVRGNFFYEACDNQEKLGFFLENQDEVREVISASGHVKAVLQAHIHHFHAKKIDHVPYITCPAMGDNICGPNVEDNVPEIYTILSLEKGRLVAKAFSGKYCFAGYEGD